MGLNRTFMKPLKLKSFFYSGPKFRLDSISCNCILGLTCLSALVMIVENAEQCFGSVD